MLNSIYCKENVSMRTFKYEILVTIILYSSPSFGEYNNTPNKSTVSQRGFIKTYSPLLGGEKEVKVKLPTDEFYSKQIEGVNDDIRFPGKNVSGRSPAITQDNNEQGGASLR